MQRAAVITFMLRFGEFNKTIVAKNNIRVKKTTCALVGACFVYI